MVLPDRIELSTSPLPRESSTTELRQRDEGELAAPAPLKAAQIAIAVPAVQPRSPGDLPPWPAALRRPRPGAVAMEQTTL